MRTRLLAGVLALAVVGGCTSRVGEDPSPFPKSSTESPESAEPTGSADPDEGPVDLPEQVDLSPVVGSAPSGAPTPVPTAPSTNPPPSGAAPSFATDAEGVQYLLAEPFLRIRRLESSRVELEPTGSRWVINIELSEEDGQVFGQWTRDHVGEQVALVVDGEVIFAPTIQSAIAGGEIQISGDYSQDEAREILDKIIGR
jgi:preprotein translocase subunit SecD